jgi:nucleoid DNA-binding protein
LALNFRTVGALNLRVEDGYLDPDSNYTAFVEVIVPEVSSENNVIGKTKAIIKPHHAEGLGNPKVCASKFLFLLKMSLEVTKILHFQTFSKFSKKKKNLKTLINQKFAKEVTISKKKNPFFLQFSKKAKI